MDIFEAAGEARRQQSAPLADRMRPQALEELVGHREIVGEGSLLRRALAAGALPSVILWGPPGSGKTTLARLIGKEAGAHFEPVSAVSSGVADLRRAIEAARQRLGLEGRRTLLFIDEVHRFNKGQQDAVLPDVERGVVSLIGATTENPYFEVNAALLSRCHLYRLEPLGEEDLVVLLGRALADEDRGLGQFHAEVEEEALRHLATGAKGDARAALNSLELAVLGTSPGADGVRRVGLAEAAAASRTPVLQYDRAGDNHYDTFSAWIKSMRGSDPDAALYYLARMLEAGEEPRAIARRLLIHAAEDVGLADPQALVVAAAAAQALEWVGLPEGRIPLAEATLYIATAPKSNSVVEGINRAQAAVRQDPFPGVPAHLRDANYQGAARLGHGKGYRYPHDDPRGFVEQQYLPEGVKGGYYRPGQHGHEKRMAERLSAWWGDGWPRT